MIKFDLKMPSTNDLVRAAMAEIERGIVKKAQRASALHGGVTVKFDRKSDGTIKSVNFQGSEAAVEAAKTALANH
jgi:hypothetical protein